MKCFIASAFGKADVDQIFDRAIKPILRTFEIQPLRVDRVEHNDDIDNKIFELLNEADFCIADLTYARPSAYYEAGYAFGQDKQVIYIARSDHFRDRDDDRHGNLRVHFDLKMKNIISWTKPTDAFRTRLQRRIRKVIQPLFHKAQEAEAERERETLFSGMSQNAKLVTLKQSAEQVFATVGFQDLSKRKNRHNWPGYRRAAMVRIAQVPEIMKFEAVPRLTRHYVEGRKYADPTETLSESDRHYIRVFASLARTPRTTLSGWLPVHAWDGSNLCSNHEDNGCVERESIIVIDGIKSREAFEEELKRRIERVLPPQKNSRKIQRSRK